MHSQYFSNIKGSIEKYKDWTSAKLWLKRATLELSRNELDALFQAIYEWATRDISNRTLTDELLELLAEFDAAGSKRRRADAERQRQRQIDEDRARTQRLREEAIRAERERIAREAREHLRAQQAAIAKREQLRQEQLQKEADERKSRILTQIDICLQQDFLAADNLFQRLPRGVIPETEFQERKLAFVRKWFADRSIGTRGFFKFTPDAEQIAAIAAVSGHVQVVARAGSGKTATLVGRTIFLIEHCNVQPSRILLLAFNRKAATEIRRRLLTVAHHGAEYAVSTEINERAKNARSKGRKIDLGKLEAEAVDAVATRMKIALPHIMTFHALAYAIVHPDESLLSNDPEDGTQALSRAFQSVIDDQLKNPAFEAKMRELMIAHFREDWDRIVARQSGETKEELLRLRRHLPRQSLGGEPVKSYGEKLIADFLFEHDIAYKYERNHWWNNRNYRPDFTIFSTKQTGLIIEYFGLVGDSDYDEMSREKRSYWHSKPGWKLLEFSPTDITSRGEEAFRERLKHKLEQHDIVCQRLSEDEIWHRVRGRAIDQFTTASVHFVGRCRKQSLSPNALRDLIRTHEPVSLVERRFLALAHTLYAAHLERLAATDEDDFDGLMQRAASAVISGRTKFCRKSGSGELSDVRFVCIDEFQDFSDLFHKLLCAIRQVNPTIELFCVGDDWQAINGFAGSDLKFFEQFEKYVGKSRRLYISTNYRSAQSIVAAGNALMKGMGKPAVAHKESHGTVLLSDVDRFRPSLIEQQRHPGDIITPMVSRIANSVLATGSDLVVLSRQNSLPWFVNSTEQERVGGKGLDSFLALVRSVCPRGLNERISISTTHKFKGLEKSTVIIVDAVARRYPLVHPDWVFSRVLGDNPNKTVQEERRLFYVALTRAINKLVICTSGKDRSPFLDELQRAMTIQDIDWSDYPPVTLSSSRRLVVKVGNQDGRGPSPTLVIKDQLKAAGYQWQMTGWPGWAKTFPTDGFNIEQIQAEVWAAEVDGVEVRVIDESERTVAKFFIHAGRWLAQFDRLASLRSHPVDNQGGEEQR